MLRLVTEDEEQPAWVMDEDILPDLHLISRVIRLDEVAEMNSTELAWEISRRILLVQRWARYYRLTTTALTVLGTGLMSSTRR